jgi:hypothetical protein
MKKVMLLCIIALTMGCFAPRVPQPYTYRALVQPTTDEGKKCAIECKKIQLMEKQLSEAKVSPRDRNTAYDLREIENLITDGNYESCVVNCGGTYETREGMR